MKVFDAFGGKIYEIFCRRLPLSPRWETAATCDNLGQTTVHRTGPKIRWTTNWKKSPRFQRFHFKDLLTPYSQKYLTYINSESISRRAASAIFQLRVGHTPLNQYLHQFKKIDSPHCPACGHPKETAEHFLLQCPKYAHERWPLLNQTRGRPPKFTMLLSSLKYLKPLANYMDATGRFELEPANPPSE